MRYSLHTLLIVVTLTALVAAAFAFDTLAGMFAYIGCFLLFMSAWREKARIKQNESASEGNLQAPRPELILLASFGILMGAGIAFCGTCTFAQAPFTELMYAHDRAAQAEAKFRLGLWVSLPLGTAAALFTYWLSWPRPNAPAQ